MPDDTRYVEMSCACAADWIEDRIEPGPTCPVCGHHESWESLESCSRFLPLGPREFDVSADDLTGLLERRAFRGSLSRTNGGHVDVGRWTYRHRDGGTTWKVTVDIEVFSGKGLVRSVLLSYWAGGTPAVQTTVISGERLLSIITTIVRTIQQHSALPVPGAEGIFCDAPVGAP